MERNDFDGNLNRCNSSDFGCFLKHLKQWATPIFLSLKDRQNFFIIPGVACSKLHVLFEV